MVTFLSIVKPNFLCAFSTSSTVNSYSDPRLTNSCITRESYPASSSPSNLPVSTLPKSPRHTLSTTAWKTFSFSVTFSTFSVISVILPRSDFPILSMMSPQGLSMLNAPPTRLFLMSAQPPMIPPRYSPNLVRVSLACSKSPMMNSQV